MQSHPIKVFLVSVEVVGSCVEVLVALQRKPNTRPYSQYPPSLYALKDWWDKRNVTWFVRGKHVKKFSVRVIAVEFVYSIKTRRRFHSHAKCTYRVLARFTSLLFAMTFTIATAYIKVRNNDHFHPFCLKNRRFDGKRVTKLTSARTKDHSNLFPCKQKELNRKGGCTVVRL